MKDTDLNKIGFITLGLAKFCGLCGLLCMFVRSTVVGIVMISLAFILVGLTIIVSLKAMKLQKEKHQRGEYTDDKVLW